MPLRIEMQRGAVSDKNGIPRHPAIVELPEALVDLVESQIHRVQSGRGFKEMVLQEIN